MTKPILPPGHVLIRVEDLAELLGRQAQPASPAPAQQSRATIAGLSEAISLVTAEHEGITSPGLSGDVPPGAVTAALTVFTAALLRNLLPADRAAALLIDLGIAAAAERKP